MVLINLTGIAEDKTRLLQVVPLMMMGVIYFFPIFYLWKFSKHSKESLANNDSLKLSLALRYLKLHYKFMAILILVIAVGYLIAGVAMFMSGNLGQF